MIQHRKPDRLGPGGKYGYRTNQEGGQHQNEHRRSDPGSQIGSGDAGEQVDQEDFDRGRHRDGRNRNRQERTP